MVIHLLLSLSRSWQFILSCDPMMWGAVATGLVRSSLDRTVLVLGQDSLTLPVFTQVYKWVPANLILRVTLRWTSIPSRGNRNTSSCFSSSMMGYLARMHILSLMQWTYRFYHQFLFNTVNVRDFSRETWLMLTRNMIFSSGSSCSLTNISYATW